MFTNLLSSVLIVSTFSLASFFGGTSSFPSNQKLSERVISLGNRQIDPFVNEVFKDNILLNLAYLRGTVSKKENINWDEVRRPFVFKSSLQPGQTFAFHDEILPEFRGSIVSTSNAHFSSNEGFKSFRNLPGNGVCHLASLIYWAAKDAGLDAHAPTNHDFAIINEVPGEYGVSIYSGKDNSGQRQNLYVRNNFSRPIEITFSYDGADLRVVVSLKIEAGTNSPVIH